MPSDEQIRTEVHRIADGVEVDTRQHLAAVLGRSRRRRRWVPVAAAASVAAVVVVGGVGLSGVFSGDDADIKPIEPLEQVEQVLPGTPDGTVPSSFGHTRESLTALLEDRGLKVEYGEKDTCPPEGRPAGTEPAIGTPVEPGDTVTILISYVGPATDCYAPPEEAWGFLDFATGRGPAPDFAGQVALFVDGEPTETLAGAEAAQGDWGAGSALDILRQASEQVRRDGDEYLTPHLGATTSTPPDVVCGVARPDAVGDREALTLTIGFDNPRQPCPARVAIYTTDGAIDAVVAWSAVTEGGDVHPIPDVVGLPLADARNRMTAAGYAARVEEQEICNPREGIVVEQAPTQQVIDEDWQDEGMEEPAYYGPVTLVVEVPHTTRDCAALDAAAAGFVEFARGGPPPDWAPEVMQLLGYTEWDTVTADRADERDAWSFCSGLAPEECGISALVLAGSGAEVETGEFADYSRLPDSACDLIDRGGLPEDLYADDAQEIVLYPAEISSCADEWQVSIWIDGEGRIKAVNLLVPR